MTEGKVELQGVYEPWHGSAYAGQLIRADGTSQPVLAILGSVEAGPDALSRAQQGASLALRLRGPGVLPLLRVCEIGGQVAWIYEHVGGIGLNHFVGSGGRPLPSRVAAEVVASVAESLLALGYAGYRHPGPEPADLLLDDQGQVHIANFASPFSSSPAMRAPGAELGEEPSVYRLGILLAHLASGIQPAGVADEASHGVMLRRVVIHAMDRPGSVLSDRYGNWIRGMLAWDPGQRPPLSAIPDGIRTAAVDSGILDLEAWAQANVALLMNEVCRESLELSSVGGDLSETTHDTEDANPAFRSILSDNLRDRAPGLGDAPLRPAPTLHPVGRTLAEHGQAL